MTAASGVVWLRGATVAHAARDRGEPFTPVGRYVALCGLFRWRRAVAAPVGARCCQRCARLAGGARPVVEVASTALVPLVTNDYWDATH